MSSVVFSILVTTKKETGLRVSDYIKNYFRLKIVYNLAGHELFITISKE